MSTWNARVRRSWWTGARTTGAPLDVRAFRDAALALNTVRAYVARPVGINDQLQEAHDNGGAGKAGGQHIARGGTDPGAMVASWRSGWPEIPLGMTALRGYLYAGWISGTGAVSGTYAKLRVYSDVRPYDGTLSAFAQSSAIITYSMIDTPTFQAVALPIATDSYGWTYVTVTAWTDGGGAAADPKAVIFGLELHASLEDAP